MDSPSEDLYACYKVCGGVIGIHGVLGTEFQPASPMLVGGSGLLSHNAGLSLFLRKQEGSAECMCGYRWDNCLGLGCGQCTLK